MSENSKILYLNFLKKAGISSFLQNKANIFYEIKSMKKNITSNSDISEIKNLNDLEKLAKKQNILQSNEFPNQYTIGKGNEKSNILILGDFPEEENEVIKVFAGNSKIIFNKMLKAINLNKEDIYVGTFIYWVNKEDREIDNEIILKCLPFVQKQIEIINPKIILLMGTIAAKAILNSNLAINQLRGKWHKYKSINMDQPVECLVTYNPKHLIKFSNDKKNAWEDLQTFEKKIKNDFL